MKHEADFLPSDKHQRFLQIDTTILGVCGQACPNYQKSKFVISLQYLKKVVSDEVAFLHADKYESLLQIDIMFLMGMVMNFQPNSFHTSSLFKQSSILKFQDKICLENILFVSNDLIKP